MFLPAPNSRIRLAMALTFAIMLPAAPARALHMHPHKLAKEQIEDLEQQWRTAALAGDTSSLDRLLSDDFVGISWDGQVSTKEMQLDRVRTRSFILSRVDLSDTRVKVLGSVAIVTSLAQVEGSSDGTRMNGMFRYTRVYQHLPSGAWKITNFEATRVPDPSERTHHPHNPGR